MTFSTKEALVIKEAELRVFWRLNDINRQLIEKNPMDPQLDELRDEFDVMAMMTDWPALRDACRRAIRMIDAARAVEKVGAA